MKQIFPFLAFLLSAFSSGCRQDESFPEETPHFLSWQGDTSHFEETDGGGWILDSPDLSGEASVYMPVDAPVNREYSFLLTVALNPSSRNYARFYLWSESSDASSSGEAFFLRLGYTGDNICLCRQAGGSAPEVWITGREKRLDADWSEVHVRLTVDDAGVFRLFTRLEGEAGETEDGKYASREPLPMRPGYLILNCKFTNKGRNAFAFEEIAVRATGGGSDGPHEPDREMPALTEVKPLSSRSVVAVFDRAVDISVARFTLSGEPAGERVVAAGGKQVTVTFRNEMQPGSVYRLAWEKVRAVNGSAEASGSLDFTYEPPGEGGDPAEPGSVGAAELVINEILYDPFSGGSEYFELHNRTSRVLSLSGLSVAVRRQDGTLSTAYSLSELQEPLEPAGFRALTRSKAGVTAYYSVADEHAVLEVKKLPALANAGATLVLFDTDSRETIDEVPYAPSWHNPLLPSARGVSLERISADAPSAGASNWTSAAATAGYGTPGYRNSQSVEGGAADTRSVSVSAPVRSSAAGMYEIVYTTDKAGYKCRSEVYDLAGRRVARITVDETVGLSGVLRWDGKGKNGKRLISGLYIYYAEFFHSDGAVYRFKKAFAVAG